MEQSVLKSLLHQLIAGWENGVVEFKNKRGTNPGLIVMIDTIYQ